MGWDVPADLGTTPGRVPKVPEALQGLGTAPASFRRLPAGPVRPSVPVLLALGVVGAALVWGLR